MATVVEHTEMSIHAQTPVDGSLTAGGRSRLARLFDTHFDEVYRFCLGRSAERTIAEDAAAQAFVEAARALAADPGREIDVRWLYVTARRRLIDGWRRQGRQMRLTERIGGLRPDAPEHGVEPIEGARAWRALRSLPDRQRSALVLRYLDEYSVSEIAEFLELSYQAAESLLARARRSFEQAWSALGDDDD